MNEIIKIAERLTKIAEELIKLAPRREKPPVVEEMEKAFEELERLPPAQRVKRVRVKEDEILIEVTGRAGEALNRLLATLQDAHKKRRTIENEIDILKSTLESFIEKGLHIKLKKEMDFEQALEELRKREEEGKKATLILIKAGDRVAKLSEFIRFSLSREKIMELPVEFKERLIRELNEYPQLIDRIVTILNDILAEMVKVSAGLMANVDVWRQAVEQAETMETETRPEATASLSVQAQGLLSRIWEWIKGLFDKVLTGIRKLLGLETKLVETLEDMDETLARMESVLEAY